VKIPLTLEEMFQQVVLGALSAATVTGVWWLVTGGDFPSATTGWLLALGLTYACSALLSLRRAQEIRTLREIYEKDPDDI
jgi:hypothetical protein